MCFMEFALNTSGQKIKKKSTIASKRTICSRSVITNVPDYDSDLHDSNLYLVHQ